ncbi:MAG: hypothetical protein ACR2O4_13790, partial [Hyphomicrobiaceae bacterium]
MLSDEQKTFYAGNGYLVVPDVFNAEELAELNAVTDRFIENSRSVTKSNNVYDVAPDHSADAPKVRRVKDPTLQHEVYDKASRHPRLLS